MSGAACPVETRRAAPLLIRDEMGMGALLLGREEQHYCEVEQDDRIIVGKCCWQQLDSATFRSLITAAEKLPLLLLLDIMLWHCYQEHAKNAAKLAEVGTCLIFWSHSSRHCPTVCSQAGIYILLRCVVSSMEIHGWNSLEIKECSTPAQLLRGILTFTTTRKDGMCFIQLILASFLTAQLFRVLHFNKFRGSSSAVCICAFGVFLILGGALMVFMGYYVMHDSPFWTWAAERRKRPPPIQVAGPLLFISGAVLLLGAILYSIIPSSFFKMYLHHTRRHDEPVRVTTTATTRQRGEQALRCSTEWNDKEQHYCDVEQDDRMIAGKCCWQQLDSTTFRTVAKAGAVRPTLTNRTSYGRFCPRPRGRHRLPIDDTDEFGDRAGHLFKRPPTRRRLASRWRRRREVQGGDDQQAAVEEDLWGPATPSSRWACAQEVDSVIYCFGIGVRICVRALWAIWIYVILLRTRLHGDLA
ncbi:unnamed protein product [Nippostrongylus brasiliensis]|uniref:Claudin-like protein n=1 Tax=Nippostrongylus brasiliensis TaxID=27835 RepID=A0A0N4YAH9_NIPBR|nr:unnamed protein product [Nippostrongylus brasiliensis]